MSSYAGVFTHPFYSVTKSDGKFSITGLDAGTYELTAWHEKLGVQKSTVTVTGSETKSVNFKFSAPPRSSGRVVSEAGVRMGPTETTIGREIHAHGADHGAHHEELSFWRKYVFSTDHKTIGIRTPSRRWCSSSSASA
jgi:hypothetical protein